VSAFAREVSQSPVRESTSHETGTAKSTLSAVLKGKRRLAVSHIEALCNRFQVDPNVFLAAGG